MTTSSSSRRIQHVIAFIICLVLLSGFAVMQSKVINVANEYNSEEDQIKATSVADNDGIPTSTRHDYLSIIPETYNASLFNPGWKCSSSLASSSSSSKKKLIFIHVFKTAGSTFRTFFDNYGKACNKGVTTIISCSQLSSSSLYAKDPNVSWEPDCTLKKTITRSDSASNNNKDKETGSDENSTTTNNSGYQVINTKDKKVSRAHLQKYSDIVIGHLPIGIHKSWLDESTQSPIEEQYIAFFREPFVKFVSGRLFVNQHKHWTLDQAVHEISNLIRSSYEKGEYYNGYIKYLTTPEQKEYGKKNNISNEEWVGYINQNIIDMHVVVGIVEAMGDSVELIQSLIDVDRERTVSFQRLINPSDSKSLVKNKSVLSSSQIVIILKEDEDIWRMFEELLKYEFDIYNFALKVHELQIKELRTRHGDRYKLVNP